MYTQVLDDVLVEGSNQVRTGFLQEVGVDQRDGLPTLLHEQITCSNWRRRARELDRCRVLGVELLNLAAWLTQRSPYERPRDQRKGVWIDKAFFLSEVPTGRVLMNRFARDSRKWNVRVLLSSPIPANFLKIQCKDRTPRPGERRLGYGVIRHEPGYPSPSSEGR